MTQKKGEKSVSFALAQLVEAVEKSSGGVRVETYPRAKTDANGVVVSAGPLHVQVVTAKNPKVSGSMTVYPDGSGAPAELSYRGMTYSFDMLGEIKTNGVHVPASLRKERKVIVSVLTSAYEDLLRRFTDADWTEKNVSMYES